MRKILLSLLCLSLITGCFASTCTSRIDYYNIETDGHFTPEKVDEGLYRINHKMKDYYINLGTNEFFNDEFIFNWSNHTFIIYNFKFHYGWPIDKDSDINMFSEADTPYIVQYDAIKDMLIFDTYDSNDEYYYDIDYQNCVIELLYILLPEEQYDAYEFIWGNPISVLLDDLDEITATFPPIENPVSSIPYLQIIKRQ